MNITVKRIIELLDDTSVVSEEDYIKLVHKIKDWNERSKAERSSSTKEKKESSTKVLKLTEKDIDVICDNVAQVFQGEIDNINEELKSLESPVNKYEFINERMNRSHYLTGEISGTNYVRAALRDKLNTLKSNKTE